ncbi:MAG: hypothetical protein P0S93_04940 [Candidatus Neptunochlamydia sp.]|nr:hypothetical protein [Candidatus Neptunochlamydia sp.]
MFCCEIQFELDGRSPEEEGYGNFLCAKVFQTFGVHSIGIVHSAFVDCINCILVGSKEDLEKKGPDETKLILEQWCTRVLSLFQEMGPRDAQELMMVTKIIILDHLSNREFVATAYIADKQKRSGVQCKKYAVKGKTVCCIHGAYAGPKTIEGRKRIKESKTKHGRSTKEAFQERRKVQRLFKGM